MSAAGSRSGCGAVGAAIGAVLATALRAEVAALTLVALGAARELTGRATFRLYGL